MPAEWASHDRCLLAWPGRDQVPVRAVAEAREAHAEIARTLSEYEPVLMLAYPGFGRQAEAAVGPTVEVLEVAIGTVWLRDTGPIFAVRDGSDLVALDFRFNSWGRSLPPYRHSLAGRLCPRLGIERVPIDLVLEGGAFAVDGYGTVIAIESSILNENRNPGRSREDFERAFRTYLGAERTVWLPAGLADDETDGHADNVVAFVGPGRVVSQLPEHRPLLEAAGLEVIPFDVAPAPIRYLNFYVGNGCVLVPTAGNGNDGRALAALREHFPDRDVIGVPGLPLAAGGGGVHCITQQIPLVKPGHDTV
jgi:agmatine deiminase